MVPPGMDWEDILRMFLLPMRYLKTAKLIDTVDIGLDKQLSKNEDYSHKVWAKSKVDNSVYINIYNYSNQDKDLTRVFYLVDKRYLDIQ